MKLAQLQRSFQTHMLHGDPAIAAEIVVDERFPGALRLGVYTEAYAARLAEVLAETFPAVQAALGTQSFATRVAEFAREHPSRFRSARAYGAGLGPWLAARLKGPRALGLADLVQFEWAMAAAFDAADQRTLAPDSLAGIQPEQWPALRFTFSPTVRRVTCTSNCVAWWRFACADQPRPARWRGTCAQHWVIWRRDLAVFYRRLSRAETQLLDAALQGRSFGELCEQLPDPAAAAATLHGWFSAGFIVGAAAQQEPG